MRKKGQKRVKIEVFGFLPYFTPLYPIFPILPYFGPDLGLRFGIQGDGMVTDLGRPRIGARPHLGNGVTLTGSDVRLILGTSTSLGMA